MSTMARWLVLVTLVFGCGPLGASGCTNAQDGTDEQNITECGGAFVDDHGICRKQNGQFAKKSCCACIGAAPDNTGTCVDPTGGPAPAACCEALCGGATLDAGGTCRKENGQFALSNCCAALESARAASLISWNLEYFPLTPDVVWRAAEIIDDLRPDVVAIQEIADPNAFSELVSTLVDYDGVMNDDPGAFLRLGLLYRHERVSLDSVDTLFQGDGYAFPRPPLKAHVTILEAGPQGTPIDFVALVIHLKAQLDAESEARRRAACEALDVWVREQLSASEEQDYILLGDFNDKLTDPPQWNVFGAFLNKPEIYTFLTLPAAQQGEYTYIPFQSMIDHVLVTVDALGEVGSGETEVLPLELQVPDYLSITDHRPVRTWLRGGTDASR